MVKVIRKKKLSARLKSSIFGGNLRRTSSFIFMFAVLSIAAITYLLVQHRQDLRQNASYDPATKTFLATFDGTPTAPLPWEQVSDLQNFDVAIHSRDADTWPKLEEMESDHGMDCSASTDSLAFPMHHIPGSYPDSIFNCKNHLMTSIKAGGYGEIILTPNAIANWSNGIATISVDVSTYRSSSRDWWGITISPYDQNLVLPLEDWLPDLDGYPPNAIHFTEDGGSGTVNGEQIVNGIGTDIRDKWWTSIESLGITQSKANRSHYIWTISRTHVTAGIQTPAINSACPNSDWNLSGTTCSFNWIDKDLPTPLSWTQGVVQFEHHSYNPEKDCSVANNSSPAGTCTANTWHWDNFSINPADPFTIIKGSPTRLIGENTDTVTANFPNPAPANSHLRFAAVCLVDISLNGDTFKPASNMATTKHVAGDFNTNQGVDHSYFIPIPEGTNQVAFKFHPDGWYTNWPCLVEDPAIWSQIVTGTTQNPTPTSIIAATPTTSQPTLAPTSIPAPTNLPNTPTPVPPTNAPILPTSTPFPTLSINDTTPPSVTITQPLNGSTISSKNNRTFIAVTARDNVGINKVEFYINGTLVKTDGSAPYSLSWYSRYLTPGTYTIKAIAYDKAGNKSSAQISVIK